MTDPSEARQRAAKIVTEVAGRVMQARIGDASRDWSAVLAERKAEAVEAILPMLAAEVQRAVDGAKAEGYSIGYKEGLARGAAEAVDGERVACAVVAETWEPDGSAEYPDYVSGWESEKTCAGIAAAIRARQRAGGYDPEVGYFDAWKGSD